MVVDNDPAQLATVLVIVVAVVLMVASELVVHLPLSLVKSYKARLISIPVTIPVKSSLAALRSNAFFSWKKKRQVSR